MEDNFNDYHLKLDESNRMICVELYRIIQKYLPDCESKIWHGHPVWFDQGNPLVGYDALKDGIRLLFWSGQSFRDSDLKAEGKFKAAEIRFSQVSQINEEKLKQYLMQAKEVQWDYKNIVKRKGVLERLK